MVLLFRISVAVAAWSYDPMNGLVIRDNLPEPALQTVNPDMAGGVFVTWSTSSSASTSPRVYVQHVLGTGQIDGLWPIEGVVPSSTPAQDSPVVVADGSGGVIVVCEDSHTGTHIYAFHLLSDGTLDPSWPDDGAPLCAARYNQNRPQIVSDGVGGALAIWEDFRGGTGYDIYAARVRADGSVMPGFPYEGTAVCKAAGDQLAPGAAPDDASGAFVAWLDRRPGIHEIDLYVQHLLNDGSIDPAWPVNGRAVCVLAGEQSEAHLLADGGGGTYLAWNDTRDPSKVQVFVQHILPSGAIDTEWPVNGLLVSASAANEVVQALITDGLQGMLVVWQDWRNSRHIRVQHVLSSGAVDPSWPSDGREVCPMEGIQSSAGAVSDDQGGAVVAWRDERAGAIDLYAQHILSTGGVDPDWPIEGRPVALEPTDQESPTVTTDNYGGAIIVWQDWQVNGPYSLTAAKVPLSMNVSVSGPKNPGADLRLAVSPNPSRAVASVGWWFGRDQRASVGVFDLEGRWIRSLARGLMAEGNHLVHWDLMNGSGQRVGAGVYFVRLIAADGTSTRRVVVGQ